MTKESGGDIVLGPETDPNDKDSSQLSEMPDTENIQIQPNTKQLQNSKVYYYELLKSKMIPVTRKFHFLNCHAKMK